MKIVAIIYTIMIARELGFRKDSRMGTPIKYVSRPSRRFNPLAKI
jgi:hypothetical protein